MATSETAFPECCRYCPHRASVTGNCDHSARQSLVQVFEDGTDRPCPIFDEVRADAMQRLSERLDESASEPSD
jgi:hypothetical protein